MGLFDKIKQAAVKRVTNALKGNRTRSDALHTLDSRTPNKLTTPPPLPYKPVEKRVEKQMTVQQAIESRYKELDKNVDLTPASKFQGTARHTQAHHNKYTDSKEITCKQSLKMAYKYVKEQTKEKSTDKEKDALRTAKNSLTQEFNSRGRSNSYI